MLVEEGGADIAVKDRWGYTPLDEAQRVGATQVVDYLDGATAAAAALRRQENRNADSSRNSESSNGSSAAAATGPANSQQQQGSGGSSGGQTKAKAAPVDRQHLQMQLQEEAEAELKRQQLLQAQQVRREVRSSMMRATRIEAVGQLLKLAEQAQEALVVKAEEIDQELAVMNETRAAAREQQQQQQLGQADSSDSASVMGLADVEATSMCDTAAAAVGDEGVPGSSSSSSSSNNVVSATKLQQVHPAAAAAASAKRRGV
jgi:hypothetical protein